MMFISHLSVLIATLSAITCFCWQQKHLLMALLSLEAIILSLTLFTILITFYNNEQFFSLIILTFGACEASLGLALLVLMLRSTGSDMVNTLTINKC
nr:NADH dehydrogenase subunit 4L [Chloeia pocicola]